MPTMPLKVWWALAAIAVFALGYAAFGLLRRDRSTAVTALVVALALGAAAYFYRDWKYEGTALPIFSYGVMLGLSLVVGWYLTLTHGERDGLPKETMANCYVLTAISAVAGARLLYLVTNPDQFKTWGDFLAFNRGGLVAYGGFLGGYAGSWMFMQRRGVRLMPWADVAAPSLASGLLITRIGCYLFGCDFGKRLPEAAPSLLKRIGTFPHWASGTVAGGDGSPAFVKQMEAYRGTPLAAELLKTNASLPVHPTQLYESLLGLLLLGLLLWQRSHQRFRGQVFLLFAFAYGYARFVLEIVRDDSDRGEMGPLLPEHAFLAFALLAMAVAFAFGVSLGIVNATARLAARVAGFVPPVIAYIALKPPSFGKQVLIQLSTSQWIGLGSALLASYFYGKFWEAARRNPSVAMGPSTLGDFAMEPNVASEGQRRGRREDRTPLPIADAYARDEDGDAGETEAGPDDAR